MIRIFEGKEVEGHLRGWTTLFVQGRAGATLIERYLQTKHHQLYLGAGKSYTYDSDAAFYIAEAKPWLVVTLETSGIIEHSLRLCRNVRQVIPLTPGASQTLDYYFSQDNAFLHNVSLKFDTSRYTLVAPETSFIVNDQSEIANDVTLLEIPE